MSRKRVNKRNVVISNGLSEDEIGSSKSEDEMSKVAHALRDELNMSEQSSTSKSEEKFKNSGQKSKN